MDLGNYADVCAFIEQKLGRNMKVNKVKLLQIPEDKFQVWGFKINDIQEPRDFNIAPSPQVCDWDLQNLNRLNLGYDEAPFTYLTKFGPENAFKIMHSVVNDNIANWLGHDSLVSDNGGGGTGFIN